MNCPNCWKPTIEAFTNSRCAWIQCSSCHFAHTVGKDKILAAGLNDPLLAAIIAEKEANHPTQEAFNNALKAQGFTSVETGPGQRSEPPAEDRDCDEMPLGVPRG